MDEVLHTLMLSGTLQEKLEAFLIPAVVQNQAPQRRRHGGIPVRGNGQSSLDVICSFTGRMKRDLCVKVTLKPPLNPLERINLRFSK